MPHRFRFSLGQLMVLIALSALVTANAIFVSQGNFTFFALIGACIGCAGLGVLFYNRRLSGWIWVWMAGQAGPLFWLAGEAVAVLQIPTTYYSNNTHLAIQTTLALVCSLLTLLGFAMTFRDIRRRLANYADAP
jgi:hypothetical protein